MALTPELARHIADRHFGIGCDQILLVERPQVTGKENALNCVVWLTGPAATVIEGEIEIDES